MNSGPRYTRRHLLQHFAVTIGTAAVTIPTRSVLEPATITRDLNLFAVIDELIVQRNSAEMIGDAYLSQFDHERSVNILTKRIRESLSADEPYIDKQTLLRQIHADFECGDIVNLHGWLLSRTEARLCALYSL